MSQAKSIIFIAPAAVITPLFPSLKEEGIEVGLAEDIKAVTPFLRKEVTAIFSRPRLSGYSVEDLLEIGKNDAHFPPVYIISDEPNAKEAEHLLSLGALDYWVDPIQVSKILAVLKNTNQVNHVAQNSTLGRGKQSFAFADTVQIIGSSPATQRALQLAKQVAKSKASVLISGESGTGKEMFARTLHAWSDRANAPFIAVNCAALPEHLLESELFGHEKGAFTGAIAKKPGKFELAHGGTLLLDEISEMDSALQAKLLRVLQEGEVDRVGGTETIKVDVRVIATTNRQMEGWIEEGKFRQDLYFRLNVIPLKLPSLSERGSDIFELAGFFTKKYTAEYNLPPATFSEDAKNWLINYSWPGNVRELQNLMERAVLLSNGQAITPSHFLLNNDEWPLFADVDADNANADTIIHSFPEAGNELLDGHALAQGQNMHGSQIGQPSQMVTNEIFSNAVIPLHEMERIMIMKGLESTSGNRTQAAEILGISVRTLRNKLSEYKELGFIEA